MTKAAAVRTKRPGPRGFSRTGDSGKVILGGDGDGEGVRDVLAMAGNELRMFDRTRRSIHGISCIPTSVHPAWPLTWMLAMRYLTSPFFFLYASFNLLFRLA
jgi:hypothetical protein